MSNTVKIVCPQCHGHKRGCAPVGTPGSSIYDEGSFCMGKGWIWATKWEER